MSDLPEPLVPADCDLRDLAGFMLNTERLLASELWALATGDEIKAALSLWCRAWKQVPAASLPDDRRIIAAFAGMSAEALFNRHQIVMRGFVKCCDGRWYHRTLAEDALRAWKAKKRRATDRATDSDRLKRWRERKNPHHETVYETGDETRFIPTNETRTKRVGQYIDSTKTEKEEKEERKTVASQRTGDKPPDAQSEPELDARTELFRGGLSRLARLSGRPPDKIRSLIGRWLADLHDDASILNALILQAENDRMIEPIPWITAAVKARLAPPPLSKRETQRAEIDRFFDQFDSLPEPLIDETRTIDAVATSGPGR